MVISVKKSYSLNKSTVFLLSEPMADSVIICHDCDLILDIHDILPEKAAVCPRCRAKIPRSSPASIERVLIFSLCALIFYLPAMTYPIMDLNSFGFKSVGNILDSVTITFQQGYYFVGGVVLLTAVVLPCLLPLLLFLTSLGVVTRRFPSLQAALLRIFGHLKEWGMTDIYLLGILIAIIKIAGLATLQFHIGFLCFIALTVFNLLAFNALHVSVFWRNIGEQLHIDADVGDCELARYAAVQTAKQAGFVQCHDCYYVVHRHEERGITNCPRCDSPLHFRKPRSLEHTWAFLLVSMVLIVPANLFPIMEISSLFTGSEKSTIMDGIVYFFNHHEYGIGLIIFIASILIPLYKIAGLLIVLLTVHFKWRVGLRYKLIVFRLIEFIGRWSMLDIFVIAIMSVFINFGRFSTSTASTAAVYFCIVVITTMKATNAFDPRLLWDNT